MEEKFLLKTYRDVSIFIPFAGGQESMPNHDTAHYRKQWLSLSKKLSYVLISRDSKFQDICPHVAPSPEEKKKVLSEIAKDSKEASKLCEQLHDIEEASPDPIGVRTLFGDTIVPDHTRCAIVLLAMARLSSHLDGEARRVMDLIDRVSAREPDISLQTRNLFQYGGELRDFINVVQTT
jgi:hypothetical protein